MDHVPDKHQSIAPPKSMLIGLLGLLLMFAAAWFGISTAANHAGSDCPASSEVANMQPARCR
jgi:hypothetical protein